MKHVHVYRVTELYEVDVDYANSTLALQEALDGVKRGKRRGVTLKTPDCNFLGIIPGGQEIVG